MVCTREGIGRDGRKAAYDGCSYPMFKPMRSAVKKDADLFAVSYAERVELMFGGRPEIERVL